MFADAVLVVLQLGGILPTSDKDTIEINMVVLGSQKGR